MRYDHRDMDHDGKVTNKDIAMFHEMLDEDERTLKKNSRSDFICTGTSWTWKDYLGRFIAVLILVMPAGWVMNGTLPCNLFTILITGIMLICGIVLGCDIIDMLY